MKETTTRIGTATRMGMQSFRDVWQRLSMTLLVMVMMMTAQMAWASTFSGGSGTKSDPYKISTAADLVQLSNDINNSTSRMYQDAYFEQTTDIDLKGIDFVPIGLDDDSNHRFRGFYYGNNHTISNLTINGSYSNAGLFGYSYNAEYYNIRLVSPSITNTKTSGSVNTGALVGYANMPGANGCVVINPTINSSGNVGVFAAIQSLGNFRNSFFTGNNNYRAVGSVGQNANSNIGHAYSLSLGTGITTSTAAVVNYNNTNYYLGTITLAELPYNPGYVHRYVVNNEIIEGTTFNITTNTTVTLCAEPETEYFEQTGNNEYTIKKSLGWSIFCDKLEHFDHNASGGYCFDGKTVKLAADIDITRTAGSTGYHDFNGTFDGQGHTINANINETETQGTAPFRQVFNGCTIRNVHVTGSVTGTTHASGLVGMVAGTGTVTIENCLVEANVTVNTGTNKHCGGLVGHGGKNANLTLRNSAYTGTITCGGNYAGGLQGWSDGNTLTIQNCLFAGNFSGSNGAQFHPVALHNTGNTTNASVSDVCYTVMPTLDASNATDASYIAAKGKKTCGMSSAPSALGSTVKTLSFMTVYQHGLLIGNQYYTPPTLSKDNSGAYLINKGDDWIYFCEMLYDNDTWNRFSGKTVKLTGNISIQRVAGSSGHEFCGTFNGGGHTLNVSFNANFDGIAPFSYVSNVNNVSAAIQNLNVNGSIISDKTSATHSSGLIGRAWGTVTISGCTVNCTIRVYGKYASGFVGEDNCSTLNINNCRSSVTINTGVFRDGTHGGFIGTTAGNNVNITGCVFDGKLLCLSLPKTDHCGGFIGWNGGDATNVKISNSLFAPATAEDWVLNDGSATFCRNGATITNCYYTREFNDGTNYTGQGKPTRSVTAGPNVTIEPIALTGNTTAYNVSGITTYTGGGMSRTTNDGTTLYYGSGDQVRLTLSQTATGTATGASAGYQYSSGFVPSAGTLSGSILTMPDEDVTVTVTLRSTGQPVSITYMKADGTTATHNAIALDGTESTLGKNGQETWYFVGINISHDGKMSCYGDVNIILADDKVMAISSDESGIWGGTDCTLTIYGQDLGTGTLNVSTTGTDATNHTISLNGNVVISGGTVNATSTGNISTAISAGGSVTINRGTVSARGLIGICATNGSITLGLTNADDRIYASSYSGTVTLAGFFKDDNGNTYESGTVADPSVIAGKTLRPYVRATYAINGLGNSTGGTIAASVDGKNATQAKELDVVTLTANPGNGNLLSNLSVTDANNNPVSVEWSLWANTATFRMPTSAVTVTPTFTNMTSLSVNMPKTGSKSVTIATDVESLKVYDDGGATGNYSNYCDGTLVLTAPANHLLRLSGNITAETRDKLTVYNGNEASGTPLLDGVTSTSNGTKTDITTVISSGQSMTLFFHSDYSYNNDGLDLTVRVVDPNASYAIYGLSGSIAASVGGTNATTAKMNDVVTITATPGNGNVLGNLSVTDADGNPVSVDWSPWANTATFTMPLSAVTVIPTFINATGLSVNIPKTGSTPVTIPTGVESFKVYDDGGATGNYSDYCDGTLVLTAPNGYLLQLSGNITTGWDDYLTVYNGNEASGTPLLDRVSSPYDDTMTDITTVISSGQSMTLYFHSNGYTNHAGLDLTVKVIDPNAKYTINGLDSGTGGTIAATVGGKNATSAKMNEVVTLTATPGSDYLLYDLNVTDADGHPVSVDWSPWANTATFTMPISEVTVTPTFTNVNSLSVNIPKTGSKSITIPTGVESLKVYDDGGATGNYSNYCDGTLVLTAPEGYLLQLSGNITAESYCDYLTVYNGNEASGTPLLDQVSSTYNGTTTDITTVIITDQSMTLCFHSDSGGNYDGLDLTVTLIDTSTEYAINGLDSSTGGTIAASVGGTGATTAKLNDVVTLTATPGSGNVLNDLSVTDADGHPVSVDWSHWTNTATFTMPLSAVAVTPTFTSSRFINIPKTGSKSATIPTGVESFKVYDDDGATGNYSDDCDGTLVLTAPDGYVLLLSGNITAESCCDKLTVYNGNEASGTPLLDAVTSTGSGTTTDITTVVSTGQSMTLKFYSDGSQNYDGLDLTVTLIDASTEYAITVNNPATGGILAASIGGTGATQAKLNEVVTLTATPGSGNLLNDLIVTDANGHPVSVEWNVWTNTATFRMPLSAVTVTPTFTNVSSRFINIPKTGSKSATIPTGIQSFKVYDDGGATDNYSDGCNGTLVLTAPDGYVLQLSGNITTQYWSDYLNVYDGNDKSGTKLLDQVRSTSDGATTDITTVNSTGQSMTLYFYSNGDNNYDGLDLTVTLVDASTEYAITVSNPATGGIVTASVGGTGATQAKLNEVVTLTATPGSGNLLNDLIVTDADGHPVSVEWSVWANTATFRMPLSAVTVTPTFINATNLYVNIPKTGSKSATIPTGTQSFKVYDDGGATGNYSDNCDGTLTLTAPEGYVLQLSGNITTQSSWDYLTVYDGADKWGTKLLDRASSPSDGATTAITTVNSTGQSMTLDFYSNGGGNYAGLDLTVTLVDASTEYAITVSNPATGGTIAAGATKAKVNDVVTLTATPGSGYLLSSISVTDAQGHPVAVTWGGSLDNAATFRMPLSAVTVASTFTNTWSADGGIIVNMPKTGSTTVTIPTGVQSFKVYDDGGATGNYSDKCNGSLVLTAPDGYVLQLSGNITAETYDKLTVYNGNEASGTPLLDRVTSTARGSKTDIPTVISSGQSMTLNFYSDSSINFDGLDLTVTVGDPKASYAINVGNVTGGSVAASATTAKMNQVVTLTATPASKYLLGSISVTDANGNPVSVEWDNTTNIATFTMPLSAVTVTPMFILSSFVDNGNNTYTILDTDAWNYFCDALEANNKGYFTGKTVKLGDDINITRMAGADNHDFTGTFDGQNHTLTVNLSDTQNQGTAPFRIISNATIRNLHVTGSVTGTAHAAGLVGKACAGTMLIENCLVEANVTSLVGDANGNKHCGGVVGHGFGNGSTTDNTANLTLRNVVYVGTITCDKNYIGGLQGWSDGNTLTLENCLFAGSYAGKDGSTAAFHPIALHNTGKTTNLTATNVFAAVAPTATNANFIAADGTKTTGRATAPTGLGDEVATYSYMNTTVYEHGILYNGLYYVAPTLSTDTDNAYLINNEDDWTNFCDALYNNDTWNRFTGKTVKLANSISVTRMAGYDNHDFLGTFDGNHNKLTFTATATASYLAPFRNVLGNSTSDHAVIRDLNVVTNITAHDQRHTAGLIAEVWGYVDVVNCNVTVDITATKGSQTDLYPAGIVSQVVSGAQLTVSDCTVSGTIDTDGKYAGGIIGIVQGSASITDCVSGVTINSNTSGDGTHGGLVGVQGTYAGSTITIEGCVFNGQLLGESTNSCGGFVGWRGKTVNISNSLFAPAQVGINTTDGSTPCATFVRNGNSTPTNSYYTAAFGTAQGTQMYSITGDTGVTVANAGAVSNSYDVSELTFYTTGIKGGDVLYAASGETVSLELANTATGAPEGYQYGGYIASAGTLDGNATDGYTLQMPDEDVTISVDPENLVPLPIQRGDANGDGSISVTDIAVVVNCILQLDNPGGYSEYGADANGDGQITVTDIGVIVDKILGTSGNAASRRLLLQEVEPQ